MERQHRIDVGAAVQAAVRFLGSINEAHPPEEVAVEEIEFSEEDWKWRITLGYYPSGYSMAAFSGRKFDRQYRVITVDARTGEVLSMKMREP
jgi:hypothetical protein